jgi:hypothetical protein
MDGGGANKLYWGPRLWRIFHLLANISDRRDVPSIWRQLLRVSALVIPCAKCRTHFQTHLKNHVIVPTFDLTRVRSPYIRETIKTNLRAFHNDVNRRLEKPTLTAEAYATLYPHKARSELLLEVQELVDELVHAWTPLVHTSIDQGNFTIWKNTLKLLIALLKGGPTI